MPWQAHGTYCCSNDGCILIASHLLCRPPLLSLAHNLAPLLSLAHNLAFPVTPVATASTRFLEALLL
jgi:hypothetical protein